MDTFRHEYKHVLSYGDYTALKNRLSKVCQKDAHANENSTYQVRSLYFDNYRDKALFEKIDGVNKREKFRIRYYNSNTNFIRLEKKSKINGLCQKQSAQITREQVEKILAGDYVFLKEEGNALFQEFYYKIKVQMLRPKTIVSYTRDVFIYPAGNVRLTLDTDIRTGLTSVDFLNQQVPLIPVGDEKLLEVKYDAFLPDFIKQIMQTGGRSHSAFSKYAACRQYD